MKLNDPGSRSSQGHVFQLNLSSGGVPKTGTHHADLGFLGFDGDSHRNQDLHGGIERAVCLYSLERIVALQGEGHPIYPGSIGENLTVAGLDWSQVAPGARLSIGAEVVVEVTGYTSPCSNIAASFRDDIFSRVSQKVHPGWSRVYARVLSTGTVLVGDRVQFQAPD